jgi:NitT/TauT family transport system substrate-binding protein
MFTRRSFTRTGLAAATALAATLALGAPSQAADAVKVGVFPVSSALPYFVALERGYFKDAGIEPTMVKLIGGPALVGAMITGDIDAAANLVTIEGMNANLKKPGVAHYISVNSQNKQYQMEQFVVGANSGIRSFADLKGKKIMSAPGPANMTMARAVLAANGLKEGDYQLDQLDMGQHVAAMKAGTFDAGYTLEPTATIMANQGSAKMLEAGVIATYVLGTEKADAFVAGGALTGKFLAERPDVARRFAAAWGKALADIAKDDGVRKHLVKNTFTPPDLAPTMPLVKFVMVGDLSAEDRAEFQQFIDFATETKILEAKVDTAKYLKTF